MTSDEEQILSEVELNALMYIENKVIFGLREIRNRLVKDKSGLNLDYAIAETYILQGRLASVNDYISRRIALVKGADVKQRLTVKDLERSTEAAMV